MGLIGLLVALVTAAAGPGDGGAELLIGRSRAGCLTREGSKSLEVVETGEIARSSTSIEGSAYSY